MTQHRIAPPARLSPFRPPGWTRDAIPEDVETAHRIMPMHAPADSSRNYCASARHLINAPTWPCEQYLWAKAVLDADQRRQIG